MLWIRRIRSRWQARRNLRERNRVLLDSILPEMMQRIMDGDTLVRVSKYSVDDWSGKVSIQGDWGFGFRHSFSELTVNRVTIDLDRESKYRIARFIRDVQIWKRREAINQQTQTIFDRITT